MAKATKSRAPKKTVPEQNGGSTSIDLSTLTKGQVRKLNALRKSLGEGIADKAFTEWMKSDASQSMSEADKSGQLIADTLAPLVQSGKLRVPRGGYVITRGRRRVVVTRAQP